MTLGQIKEIRSLLDDNSGQHPYHVGENYFIRTVTMHLIGKLVKVFPQELVLVDASWVADDGRFHAFLTEGGDDNTEIEPFVAGEEVVVGRGAILDATVWRHALPTKVK